MSLIVIHEGIDNLLKKKKKKTYFSLIFFKLNYFFKKEKRKKKQLKNSLNLWVADHLQQTQGVVAQPLECLVVDPTTPMQVGGGLGHP